ncbi:protein kinase domain-containing protein [Nocardioides sp. AE5]|uniref:protein kinase domain-containing protein n=1 Tax=Nocardioides sp. AE5 TaxID=2962573 RepID=UPI00288295C2|nr:protein kinase [Nocardioides sp. AE5]MDT0200415.1 protein kinase [Nocardioides sp. AE5]
MNRFCVECGTSLAMAGSTCPGCGVLLDRGGSTVDAAGALEGPQRLGRYQLVRLLGSGGFGTVWEARDEATGAQVAVKMLDRIGGAEAGMARSQLLAEAAALGSVDSPHTLKVLDVLDQPPLLALVTDLVPGCSLRALLDEHTTLRATDALTVLRDAATGLGAVHAAGLVHGDVKPANILVTASGASRLIDFGLAALPGWITDDSVSPWGSPAYAPPEQVAHGYRDHRSDIYSLTVTLYEVLAGQRPFTGDTIDDIRNKHVHHPLPDPRHFVPDLGDDLANFLAWGTAKDPAQRPQDIATWLHHFEAAATARHGADWATPTAVGTMVGAIASGGLLASGVLVPGASTGPSSAGAAGAATDPATGGHVATGSTSSATAPATTAPAGTASAGAGGSATTSGGGGFLSTLGGKLAVAALATATLAGGGLALHHILTTDDPAPSASSPSDTPAAQGAEPAAGPEMVEKIVYTAWTLDASDPSSSSTQVVLANPDGSDPVVLADGAHGLLSPDGREVAYVVVDQSTGLLEGDIRVVPVSGGESRSVVETDQWASSYPLAWTDEELIVFGWGQDGDQGVVSVDPAKSTRSSEAKFLDSGRSGAAPAFGPDGQYIHPELSYDENTGNTSNAWFLTESPGSEPRRIYATEDTGLEDRRNFAWSPDGATIAYVDFAFAPDMGPMSHVGLMDPDGNGERLLTGDLGQSEGRLVWAPDSSRLTVTVGNGIPLTTAVIDIASGTMKTMLDEGAVTSWGMVPVDALTVSHADAGADGSPATPAAEGVVDYEPPLLTGNGASMDDQLFFEAAFRDALPAHQEFASAVRDYDPGCGDGQPPVSVTIAVEGYVDGPALPDASTMSGFAGYGIGSVETVCNPGQSGYSGPLVWALSNSQWEVVWAHGSQWDYPLTIAAVPAVLMQTAPSLPGGWEPYAVP